MTVSLNSLDIAKPPSATRVVAATGVSAAVPVSAGAQLPARPVVERYIRDNLGPRAALRDGEEGPLPFAIDGDLAERGPPGGTCLSGEQHANPLSRCEAMEHPNGDIDN